MGVGGFFIQLKKGYVTYIVISASAFCIVSWQKWFLQVYIIVLSSLHDVIKFFTLMFADLYKIWPSTDL